MTNDNPEPNTTTKQYAVVSSEHSTKHCHMSYYVSIEIHARDDVIVPF